MRNLFFAFLLLSIGVTSCSFEKNVIIGNIAGLEKGDIVYLASGNILQTPSFVKSVTVRTRGEFLLKTRLHDAFVTISVGKNGKRFNATARNNYGFFLEGFSTIELIGEVSNLDYLQISGGLYSLPEMAELNSVRKEALSLQRKGLDLFNYILALKKAEKTPSEGDKVEHRSKSYADLQEEAMTLLKMSSSVFSSQDTLNTAFLLNNPNLAYSAELLLSNSDFKTDLALLEKTYLTFSPLVQNTNAGKLIAQQIGAIKKTAVGKIAPVFSTLDMNGNNVSLSGFNGRYVLLDFWATWARSHKRIAPELVSLYGKYGGPDFQIIGVATDEHSVDNWKNVISAEKLNWTQINDTDTPSDLKIQNLFAVMEVPTCFFISPDGKIIAKGHPKDILPIVEDTLSKL